MLALALALTMIQPAGESDSIATLALERITNFPNVVVNHVNRSIGTETLPVGTGSAVEPGVFVTIGMQKLQVFDHDAAVLQNGRVTDATIAQECRSGCPAVLFDAFQYEWLKMAVEASYLDIDIATRVLFAAHADVPAQTLLTAAYASAETRPGAVPTISILVNMAGRGLRAQPVFLLPPRGIELQQGSAALGLTIEFDREGLVVRGADATLGRTGHHAKTLTEIRRVLDGIKKRSPGKESIILVPRAGVTVGELMLLVQVVRTEFPRIVLSLGQDVII